MRNRAKCKLCKDIIESFYLGDYVTCNCGEISVSGGFYKFESAAKDYANFLRVDDDGNEIMVKMQEIPEGKIERTFNKEELIKMLEGMYQNIEALPVEAALSSVSHADLASVIMLLCSILRSD